MFLNTFLWVPEFTSTTALWKGCLLGKAKQQRGVIDLPASFRQVCLGEHEISCRPMNWHANLQSHFFENDLAFFITWELSRALKNVQNQTPHWNVEVSLSKNNLFLALQVQKPLERNHLSCPKMVSSPTAKAPKPTPRWRRWIASQKRWSSSVRLSLLLQPGSEGSGRREERKADQKNQHSATCLIVKSAMAGSYNAVHQCLHRADRDSSCIRRATYNLPSWYLPTGLK